MAVAVLLGFAAPASATVPPAPTFASATVDGKTLKVTFSQNLDTNSRPLGNQMWVTATKDGTSRGINGGAANRVSISGKTVTMTLVSEIVHGETVVMYYRKADHPTSVPLRGAAGAEVANFSNQPVSNNSGVPRLSRAAITADNLTKLRLYFDRVLLYSQTPVPLSAFTVKKTPSGGTQANVPLTGLGVWTLGAAVELTLASAVALTDAVTVSYTKPTDDSQPRIQSAAGGEAASFTDQAVTVSSNRRPVYSGPGLAHITIPIPPLSYRSHPFARSGFSDPDGDALTHSITTSRSDVFADGTPTLAANLIIVRIKGNCALKALHPQPPRYMVTKVTLTATDTHGDSESVFRDYVTDWNPGSCPVFKSAYVDGTTLTLTVERETSSRYRWSIGGPSIKIKAGPAGETKTAVALAGSVFFIGPDITVDGKTTTTITFRLARSISPGQEATISYDPKDDANPNLQVFTDEEVMVADAPPAFASAEVAADGRTLTVTFDENLNTASAPAGSVFHASVTRAGGGVWETQGQGTATISGATAAVTLVGRVGPGSTVKVSYARPSANPLEDADGNDVANFTFKPVTNNALPFTTLSKARLHSDRTRLVLLFDKELAAAANLANSAFAATRVPGDGGTEVDAPLSTTAPSISGRRVTLTLASAVPSNDGIKVSYTRPTTGTGNSIKSTAGGEADSFSDQWAHANEAPIFVPGVIPPDTPNDQDDSVNVSPGESASLPFAWSGFVDQDGDAMTQSITTGRPDVLADSPSLSRDHLWVQHKSYCAMKALSPTVADNHVTTVTLTVTDPYDESASATRRYLTDYLATVCPALKSAEVRGTALTLTYEHLVADNLPSDLTKEEFTVKVGETEVAVTGISAGTVTTPTAGTTATKPFTLTLAEEVWAGEGQTVTVSYDPADADFHDAPVFTDQAVTIGTTNRRPTVTAAETTRNLPPRSLTSFEVDVADPDIPSGLEIIVPGDTATNPANAVTVTLSADRADVGESLYYAAGRVYFQLLDLGPLCELTPRPDADFETVVTVTATDSAGASGQATATYRTSWGPDANCRPSLASESPATVDRRTLTLNFYNLHGTLDEDSEPAATDFAVTVAGIALGVSGVDVSGSAVVLTLTSAVKKGETVTVSYTANASRPIRFLGGGDPAESFTDQAVDNATAQAPALEGAVVVGATLTLLYDEALDETSVPATGDFAVTVAESARGVSGVAVSGATVALTLASAVTAGQAVTVSYTKGTNPIRDTHANHYEAADLSEEAVDNHTGDTTKPRLLSATVQGATITLTYDELLDPAHEPPPGHFLVHDSSPSDGEPTVTGVAVSGRTVQVTLASAVTEAQVATLDLTYNTDPQNLDTAIQDFAGNIGPLINTSVNVPPGVKLTYGGPDILQPPGGGGSPTGGGGSPTGGGGSPAGGGGSPAGGGQTPSAGAPVASAGADLDVDPGASVTLDGTGSTDPDDDALTYSWTRLSGPAAALSGANAAQASFTAPEEPGDLVFHLTVTDPGGLSDSDQVTVTVRDL
ncbi:MAG: SwmB domain-containing protein, partial [Spirochaetaceae bacterium]|nr:SwmB domain-containing protein [Spirochaetaceae bacterium]